MSTCTSDYCWLRPFGGATGSQHNPSFHGVLGRLIRAAVRGATNRAKATSRPRSRDSLVQSIALFTRYRALTQSSTAQTLPHSHKRSPPRSFVKANIPGDVISRVKGNLYEKVTSSENPHTRFHGDNSSGTLPCRIKHRTAKRRIILIDTELLTPPLRSALTSTSINIEFKSVTN